MSKKLKSKIDALFKEPISITKGISAPSASESALTHGNTALLASLAFLFIDIRESSKLEQVHGKEKALRIYKAFHEIATKTILQHHGKIRSFDGDRIMAVFDTKRKASCAVASAMLVRDRISELINPKLNSPIRIGAGIDIGDLTIIKVGRGTDENNVDLVWSGTTCNLASKLSDIGDDDILITQAVLDRLRPGWKNDSKGKARWTITNMKVPGFDGVKVYKG